MQFEIFFPLKKKNNKLISQFLPDFLSCCLGESPANSLGATSLCCKTLMEKRVQSKGSLSGVNEMNEINFFEGFGKKKPLGSLEPPHSEGGL